jgi:hypothetical protein
MTDLFGDASDQHHHGCKRLIPLPARSIASRQPACSQASNVRYSLSRHISGPSANGQSLLFDSVA